MKGKQVLEEQLALLGYDMDIKIHETHCTFADMADPYGEDIRTFKQGFNHLVGHLAMMEFRKTARYEELRLINKLF